MKGIAQTYNLSDMTTKRNLMQHISTLDGLWEVTLKKRRPTRSLQANSYYWASFIPPFVEWLRHEWGDSSITAQQAHIILKSAVLGKKELVNKETGEVIELVPDTHDMDTEEYSTFLDNAKVWLQTFAGIIVLPPDLFVETKEAK